MRVKIWSFCLPDRFSNRIRGLFFFCLCVFLFQPLTKLKILDSSKLKDLKTTVSNLMKMADCCQKGRKWCRKTRNSYKQFLLFPQCFQKTCTEDMFVWERVTFICFFPMYDCIKRYKNFFFWMLSSLYFLFFSFTFYVRRTYKKKWYYLFIVAFAHLIFFFLFRDEFLAISIIIYE